MSIHVLPGIFHREQSADRSPMISPDGELWLLQDLRTGRFWGFQADADRDAWIEGTATAHRYTDRDRRAIQRRDPSYALPDPDELDGAAFVQDLHHADEDDDELDAAESARIQILPRFRFDPNPQVYLSGLESEPVEALEAPPALLLCDVCHESGPDDGRPGDRCPRSPLCIGELALEVGQ